MDDRGFLVCAGVIEHQGGPPSELRWVVDTARQRVVSLEAWEEAAGDWRAATGEEERRLLAAIEGGSEPQRRFPARRLPIWAEAPSARRRMTEAALEDLRRERATSPFGII